MSRSRYATPFMLTLCAAGTLGLATSEASITDLPQGYGLIQDTSPTESKDKHDQKTEQEHKCGEGKCGEGKCGEGKCGGYKPKQEETKTEQEHKCGEGKCGEGKCGGTA